MPGTGTRVVQAITSPLGFFVLALLIVESFLALVLRDATLDRYDKMIGVWIGAGLFLVVNIGVWVLVWFKAKELTFDKRAHLAQSKMDFGSQGNETTRKALRAAKARTPEVAPASGFKGAPAASVKAGPPEVASPVGAPSIDGTAPGTPPVAAAAPETPPIAVAAPVELV
jgi:hypothetical protein